MDKSKFLKRKLIRLLVVCMMISTLTLQLTWADSMTTNYINRVIPLSTFDNIKTQFNGRAAVLDDVAQLINGYNYVSSSLVGSAFDKTQMTLGANGKFSSFFTVKFYGGTYNHPEFNNFYSNFEIPTNFNFVLQNNGSTEVGSDAAYNGLSGINNSVAIAYNFTGTDSDVDTIKILKSDGSSISEISTMNKIFIPEKSGFYHFGKSHYYSNYSENFYVWVDYDGTTLETRVSRVLSVENGNPTRPAVADLSETIDLSSILGGQQAYPGFTISAPTIFQTHRLKIVDFYFNADYEPIDISTFAYSEYATPSVTAGSVINIGLTGATVTGSISGHNGGDITGKGLVYNTTGTPTLSDMIIVDNTSVGDAISVDMTGLTLGTEYYISPYATNAYGVTYGTTTSFTTLAKDIIVDVGESLTEANLDGHTINIEVFGDTLNTSSLLTSDITLNNGPAATTVSEVNVVDPTNITAKLQYVGTDFDSNITNFTATVSGSVLNLGEALTSSSITITAENDAESIAIGNSETILEGEENGKTIRVAITGGKFAEIIDSSHWGVNNLPTGVTVGNIARTDDNTVTITLSGNATGDYDTDITDVEVSCQADQYVDSSGDSTLTKNTGVTLTCKTVPTMSTGDATSITNAGAMLAGTITSDGNSAITDQGIIYWKAGSGETKVSSSSTDASYTVSLTGLSAGETYYYKAYGTNAEGSGEGTEKSFKTDYNVSVATLTGGSIVPNKTAATAGTTVSLTITPDSDMQLKSGTLKYTDGIGDNSIAGTSFVMPSSSVTISAEFEKIPHGVSVASLTGGTIVPSTTNTIEGTTVTLTITPDSDMQLKSGTLKYTDGIGDNSIAGTSFVMPSSSVTISAEFEKISHGINVASLTGGIIVPSTTTTSAGTVVTLTITPDSGKHLKSGTLQYTDGSGTNEISGTSFIMPSSNVTISGEFEKNSSTKYTISIDTLSGGTIVPSETTTSAGTVVTLTVTPDSGKHLKSGTLQYTDGSGTNEISGTSFIMPSSNVTISGEFERNSSKKYMISIDALIGGTIVPSETTTSAGTVIALTITPNTDMQLKSGTLKYADGSGTHGISGTNFVMPSSNVTVMAEFENIPAPTYTVTFDKNGGTTEATPSQQITTAGGNITLPTAPVKSGYLFSGWNTLETGLGISFTSATFVNADITVYAQWTKISNSYPSSNSNNSSSSSGNGSGGSANNNEVNTTKQETTSVISKKNIETEVDTNGKINAKVAVTNGEVLSAISSAVEKLKTEGENSRQNVEIDVTSDGNTGSVETTVPKNAMSELSKTNGKLELKLKTSLGEIVFDHNAIDTIANTNEDIRIVISDVATESLSKEVQEVVSGHAVFDFSVFAGDRKISNFNGDLTISLPYILKEGEDPSRIVVYYIDDNGNVETVNNSIYDDKLGVVRFHTTHFSQYAIGYSSVGFTDVTSTDWYSDAANFVAARGITVKKVGGPFYPNEKLTRGEFLVMVMNSYNINELENGEDNFSDAGNTYYTGYLANAKKIGITKGVGNNLFLPDAEISRQEMATFLYNAVKEIDALPTNQTGQVFNSYLDVNEIAIWAHDSMLAFVESGIIKGNANLLSPNRQMTRAEGAQVIFNLMHNE